ncbi:tyrosine-type recombinase/integrase [Parashewanella tropica]|uniref:tyrosine-type recombinase/integrase n=1 Tax=Parashewanella tropica TaxID=2547970 RepID=UPI00105A46D7|nr:site-specific integrase [Parashewanella tropica]
MPLKLNDKQIKALIKKGETGRFAVGNGLYFRISDEGSGFWVLRYTVHGKRRELTLGKYGAHEGQLTLAKAAAEAIKIKAQVADGIDPLAEKKRPSQVKIATVNDLAEDWLQNDIEKRLKHPHIPRRVYTKDLAPTIGELGLKRVTPLDIRMTIEAIANSDRPTIANDALMYCKQIFRHGIRLNLLQHNPAEAFSVRHAGGVEQSRSRTLTVDEVEIAFRVFRENILQFTRENYLAVSLLIILGVRKGELIAAKWNEFDFDKQVWHIPIERCKNGSPISVPLPNICIDWLKELEFRACGSEYVFPSRRASRRRAYISDDTLNHALANLFGQKIRPGRPAVNKLGAAGLEPFVIHDLRRTCRSLLSEVGTSGEVAERCLNHKLKGVAAIYDRYDYMEQRRIAHDKVAKKLKGFLV